MALRTSAGVTYIHGDHLGSTSATSGASVSSQTYYAYGNIRSTTGTVPTDFGFTGQRRDASAGLLFYNARYYDATIGRFVSADTVVPSANNPQALNRYSYSYNNPVRLIDPTGHCPIPPAYMGAAICLDLFIKPSSVEAPGGFKLHGDGRDFSSNSPQDASRGYIWISVDTDTVESHMNPTGYLRPRAGVGGRSGRAVGEDLVWAHPNQVNQWEVTRQANGEIQVTYDLVLGGDLEKVAPHINGTITFRPDGKGGYQAFGERDGFPWAEAYYWDEQRNVHTIFQRPAVRGNPRDLYAIEGNYPFEWWWEFIYERGKFFQDQIPDYLGDPARKDVFNTSENP